MIPDTVGFCKGDPMFIAYTAKDGKVKYIKQRERLFLLEIEKFLNMRRKKREFDLVINTATIGRSSPDTGSMIMDGTRNILSKDSPSGENKGFLEEMNQKSMIVPLPCLLSYNVFSWRRKK